MKNLGHPEVRLREREYPDESVIRNFVNALDAKSSSTAGHSERVAYYALAIAGQMRLSVSETGILRTAALLHDIGKIGTYDSIIEKPSRLRIEEFGLIRMHPLKGEEILRPFRQLAPLLPVIRYHHERPDGKGYPDGLKDKDIPVLSKIVSVAASYDSMSSPRPYRPLPPKNYAVEELRRCKGSQFDPEVVEAFLGFLNNSRAGNARSPLDGKPLRDQ